MHQNKNIFKWYKNSVFEKTVQFTNTKTVFHNLPLSLARHHNYQYLDFAHENMIVLSLARLTVPLPSFFYGHLIIMSDDLKLCKNITA